MILPREDGLDRPALEALQRERLRALLEEILPRNPFFARKFAEADLHPAKINGPEDLTRLPFTNKEELLEDQEKHPPYGQLLTYPRSRYSRMHQTSGTAGHPLRWLDTPESWSRLLDCWQTFYRIVGLHSDDRLFFPFSFGPFLGFWTAFEAAANQGIFCLPGGGMSTVARLRALSDNQISVVLCTPTYALRLAEIAGCERIDLPASPVRTLILAGEPGASIPATRARIESAWNARVIDHYGMTELGPCGIECLDNPAGLHLLESEYLVEVIDPRSGRDVPHGTAGELVVTNLSRWGSPLIRYRTGDLVRVDPLPCACGRSLVRLQGGILGRTDDMIYLRGNNFFPSALEAIIRRFPDIAEYRVEIDETPSLPVLRVELEPTNSVAGSEIVERIDRAIRDELLFRAEVTAVAAGSLPRYEMKARRFSRKAATGRSAT